MVYDIRFVLVGFFSWMRTVVVCDVKFRRRMCMNFLCAESFCFGLCQKWQRKWLSGNTWGNFFQIFYNPFSLHFIARENFPLLTILKMRLQNTLHQWFALCFTFISSMERKMWIFYYYMLGCVWNSKYIEKTRCSNCERFIFFCYFISFPIFFFYRKIYWENVCVRIILFYCWHIYLFRTPNFFFITKHTQK